VILYNAKKYWALALLTGFSSAALAVHASEFDQYLQEKNIIDSKFKISPTAHREAETAKAHRG